MNRINRTFQNLKRTKKKALIAYLSGGYPRFNIQLKLIKDMQKAGVDILELGIPFSDPIADGPTIQFASQKSLDNGTTLEKVFSWVKKLRRHVSIPIVFMSYMNPIFQMGSLAFAKKAKDCGVDGLIIPDLVPEESKQIGKDFKKYGIHLIFLVAPTTPLIRQIRIAKMTKGFLYAVSVRGVTGSRKSLPKETKNWLSHLKRKSANPVCVGFGISGPRQIRQLKSSVDGFIVGSALIDVIRNSKSQNLIKNAVGFTKKMSKECHHGK